MNTITSTQPADAPVRELPVRRGRMRDRRDLLAAGLKCAVAMPVAIWWLVGDQTVPVPAGSRLTYVISPLDLPAWAEHFLGICALLATVFSMALLVQGFKRRRFDRQWWSPLGALWLAEILLALLWRSLTAGTIGVRPGVTRLVVALGMPMLWLLVWAVTWTVWLLLRARRHAREGGTVPAFGAEAAAGTDRAA
jgi:hypothetical protein